MAEEVVVGNTKKRLVDTLVDENDAPINLTGASQVPRLQGHCPALGSGKDIDLAGVVTDAAQGVVTFSTIGTLIVKADITGLGASVSSVRYTCRVKYWDAAGLFDWGEEFELEYVLPPI